MVVLIGILEKLNYYGESLLSRRPVYLFTAGGGSSEREGKRRTLILKFLRNLELKEKHNLYNSQD